METLRGLPVKRNANGNVTFGKPGLKRMSSNEFLRDIEYIQSDRDKNVQEQDNADNRTVISMLDEKQGDDSSVLP